MALDQPVARTPRLLAQSRGTVFVAWQYRDDPETARRELQYLGVFTSDELARSRTSMMRDDGWTVQVTPAQLDPDEVC